MTKVFETAIYSTIVKTINQQLVVDQERKAPWGGGMILGVLLSPLAYTHSLQEGYLEVICVRNLSLRIWLSTSNRNLNSVQSNLLLASIDHFTVQHEEEGFSAIAAESREGYLYTY